MEPVRVKQFYGYAVCLIAVVTFLFSARALLEAAINLSNPFQASGRFGGPVASSFEGYLAWYRARFDATRSLATSALLLGLSVLLFAFHWRWLRAQEQLERAKS